MTSHIGVCSEGDREVAAGASVPDAGIPARMRYLVVPPERWDGSSNKVANRLLQGGTLPGRPGNLDARAAT